MSQINTQTAYDDNNIFAKMLNGDIPYHKVFEDDKPLPLWILCRKPKVMYSSYRSKKQ